MRHLGQVTLSEAAALKTVRLKKERGLSNHLSKSGAGHESGADDMLKKNEDIDRALEALQKQPTQEGLAHALTVIRHRMQDGGQLIVSVEPPAGDGRISLRAISTEDGGRWWTAFTSFEEQSRGGDSVQSAFQADIRQLFHAALSVPELDGIVINPWNHTLRMDKTLIRITIGEK